MTLANQYKSYRGLPPLAGLCSMQRATQPNWSLDDSVTRLKRLHYVLRRVHEMMVARIPSEPVYELKMAYSHHSYLCAEQVDMIRRRVGEMREPPLGLDKVPDDALQLTLTEIDGAPNTIQFLIGIYSVVIPECVAACQRLGQQAHPLADAPSVRVAKLMVFELTELCQYGDAAVECLTDDPQDPKLIAWRSHLNACLEAAGMIDGSQPSTGDFPQSWHEKKEAYYDKQPQRDERFRDPYNAGVNPESFLYNPEFSARDKTLMMYYKRLREIDVPEMMASILVELRTEEPWDFHMEMCRQLWDEARHAMMGEVGFVAQGIDWTEIPINFTWSHNLNTQLNPRERHGVLFFIEQGLMPKTGKRYEWEVATESGDPLSALFQDFDWADEVLHAQIGRRWYVPRYDSLKEAMAYGDACWSRVLSQWQEYRDQGLTEHENWWPRLYTTACKNWGTTPDPAALAFCETYQDKRADLEQL